MNQLLDIMNYSDKIVQKHGSYVAEDCVPLEISGKFMYLKHIKEASKYGMQQVRSEFSDFVQVILDKKLDGSILEIGMGFYGGTHMVWKQMFKQVITIEKSKLLTWKFRMSERLDGTSHIIIGDSHKAETLNEVNKLSEMFDMLFIDGDHTYDGIKRDWELYHKLVNTGGIIAFHDSVCKVDGFGVAKFLEDLSKGLIDGNIHVVHNICHSKNVGIGYEIV